MNELKKYFGAFALCVTFLFSLAGIITGAITAKERAERAIYGTEYAVLVIENEGEGAKKSADKNALLLDFSGFKHFGILEKLLPFTPFGAVWHLVGEIRG